MAATLEDLRARLAEITRGWPGVVEKKAFGSHGFHGPSGPAFAIAFRKDLRIVVKLLDEASRASLLGIAGTSTWAPHRGPMPEWVVTPEAWHDQPEQLAPWVRRAYEQASHPAEESDEAAIETLHRGATRARAVKAKESATKQPKKPATTPKKKARAQKR